jgi:hypothetical protein
MRFVDDRAAAGGNHLAECVLPDRRVGAQQVVIDDDDVGGGGALAHCRDEALVEARALLTEARISGGRHVVPEADIPGRSCSSARSPVSVRVDHSRIIGRNTSCTAGPAPSFS